MTVENSDIANLKARFTGLIAFEGAAAILAIATLIGYFALHATWCLPAFAVVLMGAVAAQIRFIAAFRRDVGKGV